MNPFRSFSNRRGSALVLVIILSTVAIAATAAVAKYVSTSARMEGRSANRTKAIYAADFALNKNFSALDEWLSDHKPAVPNINNTTTLANLSTAPTAQLPASAGYVFRNSFLVPMENGLAVETLGSLSQSTGKYRFLNGVEVAVSTPGAGEGASIKVQEQLVYSLTPAFKFAIFGNDLELFPGEIFNVAGRVHANGTFYVGSDVGLTFQSLVTSVKGTKNQHHPLDPRSGAHGSSITYDGGAPFLTTKETPPGTLSTTSPSNPNEDGAIELIEMPETGYSDPEPEERMYTKAGLKVLVNSTGSTKTAPTGLSIPANSRVYLTADGTKIPSTDPLWSNIDAVFSAGSMKDYREGTTAVVTTDLDVSVLKTKVDTNAIPMSVPAAAKWPDTSAYPSSLRNKAIAAAIQGKTLWNSQIYVTDITNTSGARKGVRLMNGTHLPTAGLTVSSQNAAYIVGNYNTGGNPPVNTGDLDDNNLASGYAFRPAAVMADAVTIVSAGYNGNATLGSRVPVATTVNTAIIGGTVPTTTAGYSGGAENFLRLLEDWGSGGTKIRLTYYGSMILLYDSKQSTARWITTGTYYNAPKRNWYFDLNFNNPNKLPKGTPMFHKLSRGQWAQIQ